MTRCDVISQAASTLSAKIRARAKYTRRTRFGARAKEGERLKVGDCRFDLSRLSDFVVKYTILLSSNEILIFGASIVLRVLAVRVFRRLFRPL